MRTPTLLDDHASHPAAPLPSTWSALARRRAADDPDQRAYVFLADDDTTEITYAELDDRARRVAAVLQKIGRTHERVLLLYPPGLDYIAGFLGCLYAGAIA